MLVLALPELQAGQNIVWVDFEQGPAMTLARLRDLGATDQEIDRFLYIEPREPLNDDATRTMLATLIEEKRPTLIVFDAYAGLLGVEDCDPNSERDIERVNRNVVRLFRSGGAATAIVDHPVKALADRSRYSTGSGRKLADADVHIRLDRGQPFGRGRTGTARLTVLKDRPGALPRPTIGTLALTSCPASGTVTWELRPPDTTAQDTPGGRTFRPTALMERVSRYLEQQTEPVSRNRVESDVKGKNDFVRLAMDCLIDERFATADEGARGARLLSSTQPYREANDLAPDAGAKSTDDEQTTETHDDNLAPTTPHEQAALDLAPPRPDLAPTSPRGADDDFAPRPLPIRQGEVEVVTTPARAGTEKSGSRARARKGLNGVDQAAEARRLLEHLEASRTSSSLGEGVTLPGEGDDGP